MNNVIILLRASRPIIALFIFHLVTWLGFAVYYYFPWFDIPMHAVGGLVSAWTLHNIYHAFKKQFKLKIQPDWLYHLVLISGTALIILLWEFHEFILERIIPNYVQQISIADTMLDSLLGLLGAFVFILYLAAKK